MDKKKYEVTIAGVEMTIISDEREEFVSRLVSKLDGEINAITSQNKRCSKLDAAILVALDTASERIKAEKRVRNLEAQIALYDANLRRMREENIKLKSTLLGKKDNDFVMPDESAASDGENENENKDENEKEDIRSATAEVKDTARQLTIESGAGEDPAGSAEAKEESDDKSDKLRQIESLLRGHN